MKPWALIPASLAHEWAPYLLSIAGRAAQVLGQCERIPVWNTFEWRGLRFPNRVGLAAGVDKDARNLQAWWALGAGFLEIGTVTPRPQPSNPGKIIARDFARKTLWNRLGFPSEGEKAVYRRLKHVRAANRKGFPSPVFINIGKNRSTLNSEASQDYVRLLDTFYGMADAFVINISSPNTTGLRELLEPMNLRKFLAPIVDRRNARAESSSQDLTLKSKPLLLKLSPDMTEAEIKAAVAICTEIGIDGFILTNTTLFREPGSPFPTEGGLSGRPVALLSERALRLVSDALSEIPRADRPLLISTGGILSPADVDRRLELGADLVQVYSALILEGPDFFRRCAQHAAGISP